MVSKWSELSEEDQNRAAVCYHLSKGAWQTLKAATVKECFTLRSPSVGAVAHYVGEGDAAQMVAEIIATAMSLINVGKNIQAHQIYPTAALIVSMPEFRLFSVADFRLAINRGVTGQYGKLYDSFDVTTLCGWLNQYWSERMDIAEGMATVATVEQTKADKFMPEWFSDYLRESKAKQIRIENERREIETKADEYRKVWEDEIFETELVEGFPIRNYKDGGVERVMKRAIFEYVAFGDAGKTNRLYAQLVEETNKRYESPDYIEAESKAILINIAALRRELPAAKILENFLLQNPKLNDQQRAADLRYTLETWEAQYYSEYLPQCIERKYPALKLPEMLWADALAAWVRLGGNENPVSKLIFNQ